MVGFDHGDGIGAGQQIVHKRGVEELAVFIEDQLLVKGVADALRHAALNLTFQNHRVNHHTAIVDDNIALDLNLHCLRIYLDDHRMDPAGRSATFGAKVVGRFQPWFAARFDRAAQWIQAGGQITQFDRRAW